MKLFFHNFFPILSLFAYLPNMQINSFSKFCFTMSISVISHLFDIVNFTVEQIHLWQILYIWGFTQKWSLFYSCEKCQSQSLLEGNVHLVYSAKICPYGEFDKIFNLCIHISWYLMNLIYNKWCGQEERSERKREREGKRLNIRS